MDQSALVEVRVADVRASFEISGEYAAVAAVIPVGLAPGAQLGQEPRDEGLDARFVGPSDADAPVRPGHLAERCDRDLVHIDAEPGRKVLAHLALDRVGDLAALLVRFAVDEADALAATRAAWEAR